MQQIKYSVLHNTMQTLHMNATCHHCPWWWSQQSSVQQGPAHPHCTHPGRNSLHPQNPGHRWWEHSHTMWVLVFGCFWGDDVLRERRIQLLVVCQRCCSHHQLCVERDYQWVSLTFVPNWWQRHNSPTAVLSRLEIRKLIGQPSSPRRMLTHASTDPFPSDIVYDG